MRDIKTNASKALDVNKIKSEIEKHLRIAKDLQEALDVILSMNRSDNLKGYDKQIMDFLISSDTPQSTKNIVKHLREINKTSISTTVVNYNLKKAHYIKVSRGLYEVNKYLTNKKKQP